MKPVSEKNKRIIDSDPFFWACAYCGSLHPQIHHVNYCGRQLDHIKFMVPACGWGNNCHAKVDKDPRYKHYFEWIVCLRLTAEERKEYNSDFVAREEWLNNMFADGDFVKYPIKDILDGKLWTKSYSE